ncbi:exodeoxyribonuclease V subunit gamma [Kribbella sp. NBC_01245]|uniref:exodeoxyribonuclease V subunit gamma n=1 Tax=Kribbella sp. NBC_01245 TaxID=2903578 RepID=UPI002E2CDEB6|nr:exodeoxyribonuclease V subunit gamma [Kribbella sp. NBC_01245]
MCAGVRFTSPRSLVSAVLGTADDDPWVSDAMAWPLLAVLDESLDEVWCEPVARHLGHFDTDAEAELRRGRRYAVAARLARLFAAYAVQRPALLADSIDSSRWPDGSPASRPLSDAPKPSPSQAPKSRRHSDRTSHVCGRQRA